MTGAGEGDPVTIPFKHGTTTTLDRIVRYQDGEPGEPLAIVPVEVSGGRYRIADAAEDGFLLVPESYEGDPIAVRYDR